MCGAPCRTTTRLPKTADPRGHGRRIPRRAGGSAEFRYGWSTAPGPEPAVAGTGPAHLEEKYMKSAAIRVATVSAATMVLGLIPLAGTSYAASCSGTGCDNLGPRGTACETADVATQRTINNNERKAELRWSFGCQAAWVRVTDNSSNSIYNSTGYIEKYDSSDKLIRSLSVAIPHNGSDWSNMLGGSGYYYRVCIKFQGNEYPMTCSTKF